MSEEKNHFYGLIETFAENLGDNDLSKLTKYISGLNPIAIGNMFVSVIKDEAGYRDAMTEFAYREQMEERELDMLELRHGKAIFDHAME